MFLNNDVSSPETFTKDEDNDDLLKDLSPLIKKQEELQFKENINKEYDYIEDFINDFSNKNDSDKNSKNEKKRKRNKNEEIVDETCLSEKDVKRQQRLIKNRESAQASRERRKTYVKGLEENLKNLSTNNLNLNSKVNNLEEENQILRLQLEKAIKGEKIEKPILKKKYNPKQYPKKITFTTYSTNAIFIYSILDRIILWGKQSFEF